MSTASLEVASPPPRGGKLEHILKAISEPVGKLLSVDRSSLDGDGPARIDILCPAPAEVDGLSLIFYFSTRGKRITYELESPEAEGLLGTGAPPPPPPPPSGGRCDGDGDPSEESSSEEEDDDHAAPDSGRRSPAAAAQDPPTLVGASTLALSVVGLLCSPVAEEEDSLSVGMDVRPPSSPRSPGVVCYSRSPGTPSSPALGSLALVSSTPPPPRLDPASVTPSAARATPHSGASLSIASRLSARLSQSRALLDGRVPSVPEKAAMRAAARDLSPGTPPVPSIPSGSGSRFAVLDSVPFAHLANVASDCDIIFRGEKGPRLE